MKLEIFNETGEFEKDLFFVDTLAHGMKGSIGVLILNDGNESAIFDSGMANSSDEILRSLKKLGIKYDSISRIFLTHRHIDHAGGSATLLKKLPRALVGIHPFSLQNLVEPSKIYQGGKELFGDFATPMRPIRESSIRTLQDGEEVFIGKEVVKAIYAPGHTSDHIAYYIPSRKLLFCGDTFGYFNSKKIKMYPTCMYPSFNYRKYLNTMKKIRSIEFETLVFPHFGVIVKDTIQVLENSLAAHQELYNIVKEYSSKLNEEELMKKIKVELEEATEIFPDSIRNKAAKFMAKGFIKGLEKS